MCRSRFKLPAGLLFPLLLLMESLNLNLTGASPFIQRFSAHEDRESSVEDLLTCTLLTLYAPVVIRGDGTGRSFPPSML